MGSVRAESPRSTALRVGQSALAAAALALLGTGCLPSGFMSGSGGNSPADRPSRSTGIGSAGGGLASGSSSTAGNFCLRLDPANPEFGYCQDCSRTLIAERCQPGAITVEDCRDSRFRANYTQLVNQCITQSSSAGRLCSVTCAAGQIVEPGTCTCVTSASSGAGTGGSGLSLLDRGQYDIGPPVVQMRWNSNAIRRTYTQTVGPRPASTFEGLTFEVRNRGGTHPRDNQNLILEQECENPASENPNGVIIENIGTRLPRGSVIGPEPSMEGLSTRFSVSTGGYTFNRRGYFFDPEALEPVLPGDQQQQIRNKQPMTPAALPGSIATLPSPFFLGNTNSAPHLYHSQALGFYIAGGATPAGGRLTVNSEANGNTLGLNLVAGPDGSGTQAGFTASAGDFPADQSYDIRTEILALDGWRGRIPPTAETAHQWLSFRAGFTDLQTYAYRVAHFPNGGDHWLAAPGNGLDQDNFLVPWVTRAAVASSHAAAPAWLAEARISVQHQRNGFNLESQTNNCTGDLCNADSKLIVTLHNYPKSAGMVFRFGRKSSQTPRENRIGLDRISVEPSNGYPRCSIKYQFRDSNQQSSYYCLNFLVKTICGRGFTPETSGCRVDLETSGGTDSNQRVGWFTTRANANCLTP